MAFITAALSYVMENPSLLIVGVLLYVFVFFLSTLFSGPKAGPNPFQGDCSRPPQADVLDQAERDKVLKQGFTAKKVPVKLDAIVIGSGVGGLTTAAILAKVGKRVLVLEQHDQAGGCCHTFVEKGFEFDVGIHYIGEMRNNTIGRLMLDQLTEGQLQWEHLQPEFDVCAIGPPGKQKLYPVRAGSYETWEAALVEKFPEEEEAIKKFMAMLKEVRKSMAGQVMIKAMPRWTVRLLVMTGLIHKMTSYFKYSNRTLSEVLDSLTDNQDLKTVLSYSFGDYGVLPAKASFAVHATLLNHYVFGASYPRGGASEIAFHMIPVIERSGGRVLVRAPVQEIIEENGKAVGVRVKKSEHGDTFEVRAPLIISNAGVINTFTKLLPKQLASKSRLSTMLRTNKIRPSMTCVSLFVGLKGTAKELDLTGQNFWSYTTNDINKTMEEYMEKSLEEVVETELPLLFISFPSSKDPTFNMKYPGKSACTVVAVASWKWFAPWVNERVKKRGDDYETLKNKFGEKIWQQTCSLLPQLEGKVEYFEVGTPITNQFYLNAQKGEIYGLDHDQTRFGSPDIVATLRAETDIPGLLLSGQDVFSCGLMGAMFGGLFSGSQALHRNLFDDLVKLKKKVAKQK